MACMLMVVILEGAMIAIVVAGTCLVTRRLEAAVSPDMARDVADATPETR